MAKFDVYPAPGGGYWLDCQADVFSHLNSRFVVPLQPAREITGGDRTLNPRFQVLGDEYAMQTHFAAAVPSSVLQRPVASLGEEEYVIGRAIDLLIGGY